MKRVVLKGFIDIPAADLAAAENALPAHLQTTRKETGCLVFEVTKIHDHPGRFAVYEEFLDQAAFAHHQTRVRASEWGQITRNARRNYQVKEVDCADPPPPQTNV